MVASWNQERDVTYIEHEYLVTPLAFSVNEVG